MSRGMTGAVPRGRRIRYTNWNPYDHPPEYYEVPEMEAVPLPARAQGQSQGNSTLVALLFLMVLALAGWIAWKTYRESPPTVRPGITSTATPVERWINADNVNLRAQPDERSRILNTLPRNTRVVLLGEYQTEPDGTTWAKVRVQAGTSAVQDGWVTYRFLN
ncbi:MAG: SH3 domain-containing protein [Blastocatellia bacterium]